MKNILLPTDFSPNSLNAIHYALHFFENHDCTFHILNVQKLSEYLTDDLMTATAIETVDESISKDNRQLIGTLVKKLSKQYKSQSFVFNGLFDYDDFISSINQAVQFHSIDLIIMGSNGATGAKEVIFGSNTLQVIRSIDCPTLTVPEHYTFTPIQKALFSTHHCEDVLVSDIEIFKEILDMHPCQLDILELAEHSSGSSRQDRTACFQSLFQNHPYSYFYLNAVTNFTAVHTATQLLTVDIHTLFVEKETFLERILKGSETSQLVYGTSIPTLFLHRHS